VHTKAKVNKGNAGLAKINGTSTYLLCATAVVHHISKPICDVFVIEILKTLKLFRFELNLISSRKADVYAHIAFPAVATDWAGAHKYSKIVQDNVHMNRVWGISSADITAS